MKRAKHNDEKKIERLGLKILIIIIVVALFLVIFFIIPKKPKRNEQPNDNKIENIPVENEAIEEEPEEQFEIVDTSDLPDTYEGYKVLGKIVIEKLGIEHKILYATEEQQNDALNHGVTWFWGPDVNEPRKLMYNWT